MNKISATLAGLALVAGASMAPAFAQGVFSTDIVTPPVGTFTTSSTGYYFAAPGFYDGTVAGELSLTGTLLSGSTTKYLTTLTFASTTPNLFDTTESGAISSIDSFGATPTPTDFEIHDVKAPGYGFVSGDRFSVGPLSNPVPEASTVVSFGALLALGGLAFLRRKTASSAA